MSNLVSVAEYEDPGFSLLEAAYLKKIITSLVDNGPRDMKINGDLCYFSFNNEKFLKAVKNSKNKNLKKIRDAQKYANQFSILSHTTNCKNFNITF